MGDIYEVKRNYHTRGQTEEESNKTMLHKGNTGYLKNTTDQLYNGLGTDNHSPKWWTKLSSQYLKQALPKGPGPRPSPALLGIFLALEKELYFTLSTSGPQAKLPRPRPQADTNPAKHAPSPHMRAQRKPWSGQSSRQPCFSFSKICQQM